MTPDIDQGKTVLAFELQGLPRMTNNLMVHWRTRHNDVLKWKRLVKAQVQLTWPKKQPALTSAALTLKRYSTREPDFDGLVSGFKSVIDGLVEAGVLLNDKQSVIGQPKYLWEYAGPKQGKIFVKVEAK